MTRIASTDPIFTAPAAWLPGNSRPDPERLAALGSGRSTTRERLFFDVARLVHGRGETRGAVQDAAAVLPRIARRAVTVEIAHRLRGKRAGRGRRVRRRVAVLVVERVVHREL